MTSNNNAAGNFPTSDKRHQKTRFNFLLKGVAIYKVLTNF